jgi:hypothetical protein
MNEIDWLDIPLDEFRGKFGKDGRTFEYRHGEDEAQSLMGSLADRVWDIYCDLLGVLSEEGESHYQTTGEVPIFRDGQTRYSDVDTLTLRDLPAVLDTLVVLEVKAEERLREEEERIAAERKERDRIRAKERRRLKKLGEW